MPKFPIFNAAYALDRAAFAHPDRTSITFGEHTISVSQAAIITRKLAQLFAQAGVSEGDRVLMVARNCPYHLFAHTACARLGAVFVPVSFRLTHFELQKIVDFCSPRAVICDPEIAARGAFESTGTLLHFVIDDVVSAGPLSPGLTNGYLALSAAMSPFDATFTADSEPSGRDELGGRAYPEGLAAILFASGREGQPKGVELTHENLWWASQSLRDGFEYSSNETVLVAAPMSHIGGFNGTTLDLFSHGGHVVLQRHFDPAEVLRLIEQHRVNIMFGVPTMFGALLAQPEIGTRDLSSWRLPLIGGAQVPAQLLGSLAAVGLEPLNVWAMTETAASGLFLPFKYCATHPGAIGRPFANLQVRIVDPETFEDLAPGIEGELIVAGPSISFGYWHDQAETKASFKGPWLRTGDLAVMDPTGIVSIVGRINECIATGGEGVCPSEVEAVLAQYPGVAGVVVVGVPDDTWGERVVCALAMEEGTEAPTLAELQTFAGQVLARFKMPRQMVVVSENAIVPTEKVDRQMIRELFNPAFSDSQPANEEI